jgi:acyl dehydratase
MSSLVGQRAAQPTKTTRPALYLEDFQPGQVFEHGPITLTAEDIVRFASAFDPQPFHVDPAAAERSFFHGLAASGWHTAAVAMRLLVEMLPIAGGVVGAGVESLEWTAPVRPGDRLSLRCQVLEVSPSRSRPDRGILRLIHEVLNQDGTVVMSSWPKLMVPCRPAAVSS